MLCYMMCYASIDICIFVYMRLVMRFNFQWVSTKIDLLGYFVMDGLAHDFRIGRMKANNKNDTQLRRR